MKKIILLSTIGTLVIANSARAGFGLGDLAVLQVGNGTETLASSGNSVFLDDFTTAGALLNTFAVPNSGANALLISGSAGSEGALSLSPDGSTLALAGYNASLPRTGSLANSTSATISRAFGSVNAAGQFTLAGTTSTQFNTNNVRTAATDGHGNYWVGGANSGTYYGGTTTTAGTVQSATVANTSVLSIQNGNLLFSTTKATQGIYGFSGTPTGTATPSLIIGTGSGSNPTAFSFNADNTLAYIADSSTISKGGGVQVWNKNAISGNWSLSYTLNPEGPSGTVGVRSLTVDFSGANPVIYGVTTESSQNELFKIVDSGSSSAATELGSAPANDVWTGVAFAPEQTPEPGTLALLSVGAGCLMMLRRKK